MEAKIETLISHIQEVSANPEFRHHQWFFKWHLQVVAQIAGELTQFYPHADKNLVTVMAWMHDYGKMIEFDRDYELTRAAGKPKLLELGFSEDFAEKVVANIDILNKKLEIDIAQTDIEIQIVSSADGCSHLIGPFMSVWWHENPDKPFEQLMADNVKKANKDWTRKIVLPEARRVFKKHYDEIIMQNSELPATFFDGVVAT